MLTGMSTPNNRIESLLIQLKKKQNQLRPLFSSQDTSCYRVFSGTIENTAVQIDRYGDYLHISLSTPKDSESDLFTLEEIEKIAGALYVCPENIILKSREKLQEHRQYSVLDRKKNLMEVKENGLTFLVNLYDYIDTGLFPDHRRTRQMVRENCYGKKVLNLFAYTGSFSVYAASGGAETVTTVDLSATYLQWARDNFAVNDFLPGMFEFVQSDITPFLEESARSKRKWDLIILDPPTFSNSRKMEKVWDIQKNHAEMIELCSQVLAKDGKILFSTNYRQFQIDTAELRKRFKWDEISGQTRGEDFSGKGAHRCWSIMLQKSGQARSSGRSQRGGRSKPSSGRNRRPDSGLQRNSRS